MTSLPEPFLPPDDEEIARVRAVRHRISERFGHDPYRLVAYYMAKQRERANPPSEAQPPHRNVSPNH